MTKVRLNDEVTGDIMNDLNTGNNNGEDSHAYNNDRVLIENFQNVL